MKSYTYTTEQIDSNAFVMRCYDMTNADRCTIHNQVHEKLYMGVTKEQAQESYRTLIQNTMLF